MTPDDPRRAPESREVGSLAWSAGLGALLLAVVAILTLGSAGCASGRIGRLRNPQPLAPVAESTAAEPP